MIVSPRFVVSNTTVNDLDVYYTVRAAGQLKAVLGLSARAVRPATAAAQGRGSGLLPVQWTPT